MIRYANAGDVCALHALLVQVNRIHHNGRPDLFKPNPKYTEAELLEILEDEDRPILVYTDEQDRVCGYAFCMLRQEKESRLLTDVKTLYLDDLCVDERMRGKHIGKALYDGVVALAREKGCYNLTLNVWACNPNAIAFYRACGMQVQKLGMETILGGEDDAKA